MMILILVCTIAFVLSMLPAAILPGDGRRPAFWTEYSVVTEKLQKVLRI